MKKTGAIGVCIKTSSNRPSLLTTINSIQMNLKDMEYRIYVHDDGEQCLWKEKLYATLEKNGHIIVKTSTVTRSGVARNALLDAMNGEQYLLRLDDDFELGGEFHILNLIRPLEKYPDLAWVSDQEIQIGFGKSVSTGAYRPAGGLIKFAQNKLVKYFFSNRRKLDDKELMLNFCDFSRNLMLLKTSIVKSIRWDEELVFAGEHLDFQLSLRKAGYRGGYVVNSKHYHRDDLSKFRNTENLQNDLTLQNRIVRSGVFKKKWGSDKVSTRYPLDIKLMELTRRIYNNYWNSNAS